MNFIDTVILGLVEGITEFLPISSTGHLILASHLLGESGAAIDSFEIFIQLGAIMAVVFLYRERFRMLFTAPPSGDTPTFAGKRGWLLLAITSLPAVILGLLTHHAIKEHLFNPITVAWALGIGGVVLLVIDRLKLKAETPSLDHLSLRQALTIGLFQCLSLWPGVSRAAATIIGGLFSGLDKRLAAEYSFIAAVPIMFMATGFDLLKSWKALQPSDLTFFAVGFVVAFVSAILAVKGFIHLLQRTSFSPFGVYRIAVALLFLWVLR